MKRLFLLFPLIFCLSSCWDYNEPSAQNYVLGLGVDYEDNKFNLSIETIKITGEPTSLSAAEGVIIESEGATISDAVSNAITKAGKKLYWGHTELVILSETVASDHLDTVCDLISRSSDIYSNVNLLVSKDVTAKEIFNAKTPQSGMASTHIANIFKNEDSSHRFICCELWQIRRDFPYALVPVIHLEDYPVVDGSAVFHNMDLVGYLNGKETQMFSLVENLASGGKLPDITIDNIHLSVQVLDIKKQDRKLNVTVILSNSSAPFDTINPKNRKKLEAEVCTLLYREINSLVTKPFGNPLSKNRYEVQVTIESSGLIKR